MTLRTGRIEDLTFENDNSQDSLLAAIAKSAEELTSGKGWPDGVHSLLENLGLISGANVVWVFQILELTDDHILLDFPFEWYDKPEHALRNHPRFNLLRWDFDTCSPIYLEMLESRKRGEWQSLIVPEMKDCPLKRDLTSQGVKSMLTIPIFVEGKWWGLLGFDHFDSLYRWSDAEISLLRTATYLLSNAIIRDRLASRNRQFKILESITESSAWELDVNSGHFWFSPKIFASQATLSDNIHISILQMVRRIHPKDRKGLFAALRAQARDDSGALRHDVRLLRDDFTYIWVEIIAQAARDHKGRLRNISGIAIEIPERKAEEEELRLKAALDPLTGIANRGTFDLQFDELIQHFKKTEENFTLLLLDIDHFKHVNDAWGHSVGDAALKHITEICHRNLRETDILCRIGGEEFAILLPGISQETALTIAERIRSDVEFSPLPSDEMSIQLTISIGVAALTSTSSSKTKDDIFRIADTSLYAAKNSGRNKVYSSQPLNS